MESMLPLELVGDGLDVPCVDGRERPYLNLDAAASTSALPAVAAARAGVPPVVLERAPRRRLQVAARDRRVRSGARGGAAVRRTHRSATTSPSSAATRPRRSTTSPTGSGSLADDVVVTTVVEHHANLLAVGAAVRAPVRRLRARRHVHRRRRRRRARRGPPARAARRHRRVERHRAGCRRSTTIIDAAHARGVPVLVDAAQLAPHRPMPVDADFVAWSGHKMYAPFGAGCPDRSRERRSPRATRSSPAAAPSTSSTSTRSSWTDPPEREEAGSPNVIGAVALARGDRRARASIGWPAIREHDDELAARLRARPRRRSPACASSAPRCDTQTLPLATFDVEGVHHALVAARLSAEYGIGVRHGCFCAHPYLLRLLHLSDGRGRTPTATRSCDGDRRDIPGAVRASAGLSTTGPTSTGCSTRSPRIAGGEPAPVAYVPGRTRPATSGPRARHRDGRARPRHRRFLPRG